VNTWFGPPFLKLDTFPNWIVVGVPSGLPSASNVVSVRTLLRLPVTRVNVVPSESPIHAVQDPAPSESRPRSVTRSESPPATNTAEPPGRFVADAIS
jgi:hypothetical protein